MKIFINLLTLITLLLPRLIFCGSPVQEFEILTLQFNDTLLYNKLPTPPVKTRTLLGEQSKIRSATVKYSGLNFNLGLVDMDGDGDFSNPEMDLLVLTQATNRQVRVNAGEGTPHASISEGLVIQVDQALFRVFNIQANGKTLQLEVLKTGNPDLILSTHVGKLDFPLYTGGRLNMDSIIAQRPFTFIYFWNTSGIPEYQVGKMGEIADRYRDEVTIIGVHCRECEIDKMSERNFFNLLAMPGHGSYCTLAQFDALHQPRSWGCGLLICDSKKIIFPTSSAKDILDWLDAGNGQVGNCD